MKLRTSGLLAVAAFAVAGLFGSAQTLAQNAYIPNQLDNTVSVISTATNTVTTVIYDPSFNYPFPVAVTPDGSTVYVANNGPHFDGNTVSVIATATNTVTATITLPGGKGPTAVAVTPDGRQVYVANDSDIDAVSVIATATNRVRSITVGGFPTGVAVTPDGRKVYVTNGHSNDVSVIATETNTVVGLPIPVGNFPAGGGVFIQPRFAGTPRHSNCHGKSVTALARTFGGLGLAAAALGYPSVQGLQAEIHEYCQLRLPNHVGDRDGDQ
jgi:YVTN family beta-propeller protein